MILKKAVRPVSSFCLLFLTLVGCGDGGPATPASSSPSSGGAVDSSSGSGSGPRLMFITNGSFRLVECG